ncbi:MAG: PIN domain-containing protein [Acidobacteria bacterium]|nr:PIN domain-containing protein [Acidobacteriota bacterium]
MPCVSPPILKDREVMSRARIHVDRERARLIQELLSATGILVTPTVAITLSPDPDDNMFLECAEEARADFLITGNTAHFPTEHKTTSVVTPRVFIETWRVTTEER